MRGESFRDTIILSNDDSRIVPVVFRQLREQSKKLVGVKRNQQLEREKQAQLLNEVKKQEDQKDETTEYFQVTSQAYCGGAMARTVRVRALTGDIVLCSWARHFTLTVPLSTQVCKWLPANSEAHEV